MFGPRRVAMLNLGVSAFMLIALVAAWWTTDSLLALSQAADSIADVLAGIAMMWAASISAAPADRKHPHGHQPAEPLVALLVATLAGALAIVVIRTAIEALIFGTTPHLTTLLLSALAMKTVLKVGIWFASRQDRDRHRSPILHALEVDARNDVAIGSAAVMGYFAARYGAAWLDAAFALPAGIWVGWGGLSLAKENIDLLMGKAADPERVDALNALVAEVPGVLAHHELTAKHLGAELDVHVHIVVDETRPLRVAHDIGVAVEAVLLGEEDVGRVTVHLDVEDDRLAGTTTE